MTCHPERRSEPRSRGEDKSRDLLLPASSLNTVLTKYFLLVATVMLTTAAWSDCLPFSEARKHVGEIKCVTGTVVRVKQGARGVHFLDFCDDFRLCPFTVVIFSGDLKSVGDVRQLQGRMIEIHGKVKEYDGRAEIVLEEYRQLERRRRPNSSAAQKLRRGKEGPLQRGHLQPPQSKTEDLEKATTDSRYR